MCQAFEDERIYMQSRDQNTRRRGYDAFHAGTPRDANPEPDHELEEYSDKRQWWLGWDTANYGMRFW